MIQGLSIRPIGANGLEIAGVDASRPLDPPLARRLNALWMSHPVIYFPGTGDHPDAHLRLSEVFGTLAQHSMPKIRHPSYDKLIRMSWNTRSDDEPGSIHGARFSMDGEPAFGWLPWHKDGFFSQLPNRGSMLNPVKIAYAGGDTSFIDTTQVYDDLPAAMKQRIADLEIVFDPLSTDPPVPYGALTSIGQIAQYGERDVLNKHSRATRQAPIAQKLVDTHPLTGAPILNLTSFYGPIILGMDRRESDALLSELLTIAEQRRYVYRHKWRMGDLLLWDNWRCLHTVHPHPEDATREMHRSTIGMDSPMGRVVTEELV
jgi:taurine dioxygenase